MKSWVVVDKSFVQGSSAERVAKLSSQHGLLMTEEMLYELVKGDAQDRSRCFSKFPRQARPFELSKNLSYLLRYELENNRSCGLPSSHIRNIDHTATENYRDPTFALPDDLVEALRNRTSEVEGDLKQLLDIAASIETTFPELENIPGKERDQARISVHNKIFNHDNLIREGVDFMIRHSPFFAGSMPHSDHSWISYRWLQIQLLLSVDYWFRYPKGIDARPNTKFRERLRHDVLDGGYLAVALQEGTFASKEKKLCEWWGKLLPNGVLYRE